MGTQAEGRSAIDEQVVPVAGDLHRRVMEAILPWMRADAAERERLVAAALEQLRDGDLVTAAELESLREITGAISRDDAEKAPVLDQINASRESARDSGTALYSTLLNIAADSVDNSHVVPIAAADLSGGIFGGVVGGPVGALAGAVALSAFTAS